MVAAFGSTDDDKIEYKNLHEDDIAENEGNVGMLYGLRTPASLSMDMIMMKFTALILFF